MWGGGGACQAAHPPPPPPAPPPAPPRVRLRAAQAARRHTAGYRAAKGKGQPSVEACLPLLEAALAQARSDAGLSSMKSALADVLGRQKAASTSAPLVGKAAVQWHEWMRKHKGTKLALTPISAGLAAFLSTLRVH
jgi:hypothetical protein